MMLHQGTDNDISFLGFMLKKSVAGLTVSWLTQAIVAHFPRTRARSDLALNSAAACFGNQRTSSSKISW